MTQSETTTTVRRQVLVNAPISEAFKVFTERFGDFKPREHNMLHSRDRRDRLRASSGRQHLRSRRRR